MIGEGSAAYAGRKRSACHRPEGQLPLPAVVAAPAVPYPRGRRAVAVIVDMAAQVDSVGGGVQQQRANRRAVAHQRHTTQWAIVELDQQLGDSVADLLGGLAWATLAQRFDKAYGQRE